MAWCDVVEPRTLRDCRIALGQSQAAFAAMLGASPESYRTWDSGRRATPLKILAGGACQILDIPEAQAVSVIQLAGVADDFRRKTMPKVAGSSNVHPGIVPRGELT